MGALVLETFISYVRRKILTSYVSNSAQAAGCTTDGTVCDSRRRQDIFLVFKSSRPAVKPILVCLQRVLTVISPRVKQPGHEVADTVTVLLFDIISADSAYLRSLLTYEEICVLEQVHLGGNLKHKSADLLINWLGAPITGHEGPEGV